MNTGAIHIGDVLTPERGELERVRLFLWRNSIRWMLDKIKRLSIGVRRRHPVTMRKASLMGLSIRQVSALRHQTGAQYSAAEWTKAGVAMRSTEAPA